jgi:hypothetical protein
MRFVSDYDLQIWLVAAGCFGSNHHRCCDRRSPMSCDIHRPAACNSMLSFYAEEAGYSQIAHWEVTIEYFALMNKLTLIELTGN